MLRFQRLQSISFLGSKNALLLPYRGVKTLKDRLVELIPGKHDKLKEIKSFHGKKSLGGYNLNQCVQEGSFNIKSLYGTNVSEFDDHSALTFRNLSLPELLNIFLKPHGKQPSFESMLWFSLTSETPTLEQIEHLRLDLRSRQHLPEHVIKFIQSLPKDMDILTQLSMALLSCQTESKFVAAYNKGLRKPQFYDTTLEDILDIIGRLPLMIHLVQQNKYGTTVGSTSINTTATANAADDKGDYVENLVQLLFPAHSVTTHSVAHQQNTTGNCTDSTPGGIRVMVTRNTPVVETSTTTIDLPRSESFKDFVRLLLVLLSDEDNLSHPISHAVHLTNCTLSDPYKAYSTGINTLAGPLVDKHRGARIFFQMCKEAQAQLDKPDNTEPFPVFVYGQENSDTRFTELLKMSDGLVIPSYNNKSAGDDSDSTYNNPLRVETPLPIKPNLALLSCSILNSHGVSREFESYILLYAVSRTIGAFTQIFWDRALGLSLENPKSINMPWIREFYGQEQKNTAEEKK